MSNSNRNPWLGRLKNGTGQDAPTWKGDKRPAPTGDFYIKRQLLEHARKAGLIK